MSIPGNVSLNPRNRAQTERKDWCPIAQISRKPAIGSPPAQSRSADSRTPTRVCKSDIRTTMNIYGDVVTDGMETAGLKVARLASQGNGAQTERERS